VDIYCIHCCRFYIQLTNVEAKSEIHLVMFPRSFFIGFLKSEDSIVTCPLTFLFVDPVFRFPYSHKYYLYQDIILVEPIDCDCSLKLLQRSHSNIIIAYQSPLELKRYSGF
jgi:hypothetical protein